MRKSKTWQAIRFGGLIVLGTAVFALGFDLFLEPNQINTGGITGLAMLLSTALGWGTVGLFSILLNIPLFILGFRHLGRKFFFGSLAGMLLTSVFLELFTILPVPETEPLLATLYGGLLAGAGIGLVLLSGASTGGTDIVARLLKKKLRDLPMGKLILAVDLVIVVLTGVVYGDVSKALYSGVTLYVHSMVMDSVIYGLDYSAVALIITDYPKEVARAIEARLERGVTLLRGEGAFTGSAKTVLLSAVRKRQVADLKELVQQSDPNAFMILQEAHQVLGRGFKRYSDEL